MKKNNKGFTLVEIVVTFSLVSAISFLLFQLILSLKNLYTSSDFKTSLLIDQGNITRRINSDLFTMEFQKLESCGKEAAPNSRLCYLFTLEDKTSGNSQNGSVVTRKFEVFADKIVYDGFTMDFSANGSSLGTISAVLSYVDDISMHFNSILTVDIPLNNKLVKGNYGLHLTLQYNDLTAKVDKNLLSETNKIEVVTVSARDIISNSLTSSDDGLYTIASYGWYDKDDIFMPRYVFKGSNPKNYILYNKKCYRLMSISTWKKGDLSDAGLKLIYEGDAQDGVCTNDSNGGYSSVDLWGYTSGDNSWLGTNSYLRRSILPDWLDNQTGGSIRILPTASSYVGAVKDNGTYVGQIVLEEKTNQGSTSLPERNAYTDLNSMVYLPSVSDYVLASSNSACTSMTAAVEGSCTSYLTKNYSYWTLNAVDGGTTNVWVIGNDGKMQSKLVLQSGINVRPVIFLKGSSKFTGKGTATDPYIVR